MEGSYAILANLPHPPVRWVGTDHAYVSLKDVIADFLAHGTPYEKIRRPVVGVGVKQAGESLQAKGIMERASPARRSSSGGSNVEEMERRLPSSQVKQRSEEGYIRMVRNYHHVTTR